MQRLTVDLELSNKFALKYAKYIEPKECYDNIAKISLNYPDIQVDFPGIQVAYGGIQLFADVHDVRNVYAKHISFVYEGRVIEPTFAKTGNITNNTQFIPIVIFDFENYVDMLAKEQETSPPRILKELEKQSVDLFKADGTLLIG